MFDKIIRTIPAVVWATLVFYLCFIPGDKVPKYALTQQFFFDKLVHFVFYYTLFKFLQFAGWIDKKTAVVICIIMGIVIEIIQHFFIVDRTFSVGDIVADILGCSTALYLHLIRKKKKNK